MRLLALVLLFLASAEPAYAYMGPGSGLAFVGSLFALIGAVFAGILGFIWYPVKRLIRAMRRGEDEDEGRA
jgi:hypothetical protein